MVIYVPDADFFVLGFPLWFVLLVCAASLGAMTFFTGAAASLFSS